LEPIIEAFAHRAVSTWRARIPVSSRHVASTWLQLQLSHKSSSFYTNESKAEPASNFAMHIPAQSTLVERTEGSLVVSMNHTNRRPGCTMYLYSAMQYFRPPNSRFISGGACDKTSSAVAYFGNALSNPVSIHRHRNLEVLEEGGSALCVSPLSPPNPSKAQASSSNSRDHNPDTISFEAQTKQPA
jgi:hypothetical protein